MTDKKSYYAVIPANVRYDEKLSPNAKLLYGEITALCNSEGYCWASNKYFAELYGVTTRTASKWVNDLISRGYIKAEMFFKNGSKEVERRYITISPYPIEENFHTYEKNLPYPIEENFHTPIEENFQDNNTSLNNTFNNKNEYIRDVSDKPTKPVRHKYGLYKNVLLSDEEMEKLKDEFPSDCEERIERLSEYIESKGAKYKNHLATIRSWARHDKEREQQKKAEPKTTGNVFLDILNSGVYDNE